MSLGKGFANKMRRFSESDIFRGLGRQKSGSDPQLELIDEVDDTCGKDYRIASLNRRPSAAAAVTKTKWYNDCECHLNEF